MCPDGTTNSTITACGCEQKLEMRILSRGEMITRLKQHKEHLKSKLTNIIIKLDTKDSAEKERR